jgi:hypothetical protein
MVPDWLLLTGFVKGKSLHGEPCLRVFLSSSFYGEDGDSSSPKLAKRSINGSTKLFLDIVLIGGAENKLPGMRGFVSTGVPSGVICSIVPD